MTIGLSNMNEVELKEMLETGLGDCEIKMIVEGNKIGLRLVAAVFSGLNRVKRQQLVYKLLNEKISSGEIHAVSMSCLTPEEI